MAQAVSSILEGIGAQVRLDEVEPGRPNVVGTFPGGDGKPAVLLGPHLDTVGVGAMSIDPFGGERHGGKIYGRGACDTKGTMAAMLWALKELGPERISGLDIGVSFAGFMERRPASPGRATLPESMPGNTRLPSLASQRVVKSSTSTRAPCGWSYPPLANPRTDRPLSVGKTRL